MVRSFRGCRHALKARVRALTGAGARFDGLSRLDFRVTRFVVGLAPLAIACLLRQANPAAKVSTSAVDAPSPRFSPKDIRNSRLLGCSSFRLFWVSLGTTQYPPRLSAVVVRSLRPPYIAGQPVRNSRKKKKCLVIGSETPKLLRQLGSLQIPSAEVYFCARYRYHEP